MDYISTLTGINPNLITYLSGVAISAIVYGIYVEVNPSIGHVFFRPDQTGNTRFSLCGIWPMIKYPFQSVHFWLPQNWDLNWIMFTQVGGLTALFFANLDMIKSFLGQ
jgi:hypothetical protein